MTDILGNSNRTTFENTEGTRVSRAWDRVNEALGNYETLKAFVMRRKNNGLIVAVLGIQAFMPDSQTDIARVRSADLEALVGQTISVKVIKIDKKKS